MISRLPPWVWSGAWVLTFIAGMINVVGLLGFEHQAVSHVTGTTSMLGAAIATLDGGRVLHLAGVIWAFLTGNMLSGIIIKDSTLRLGRHYGVALFLESVLLCLAVPFLDVQSRFGVYLATCACGLQNAMASTYSGAAVRTTHVSGMFTDLGVQLGHAIRGLPVDLRRMKLHLVIISGFVCGSVAGTIAFRRLGYDTLFIPGILTGITSVIYVMVSRANRSDGS